MYPINMYLKTITETQINKAMQCLVEVCTVLQALGYILLDEELFPEVT